MKTGRPPKYVDGYIRSNIGFNPATKARLERAAALLGAKEGKRLSISETIEALLDDSPALAAMEKLTAKAAKA